MDVSDLDTYLSEIPSHKIIGLKIHNHLQDTIDEIYKEYIFCLLFENNRRQELVITVINSLIMLDLREVKMFGALTHIPKRITQSLKITDLLSLENETFNVNFDKLRGTNRGFDKVPLWIFRGASGIGKSFLAHNLNNLTVFETDSSPTLPDIIVDDIVVLGNKYPHTLDDVIIRTFNRNIIINTFERI